MNLRKLSYTLLLLIITSLNNSFGQSINFSAKGGLNISNAKFSVIVEGSSSNRDLNNRLSFFVGGSIDFSILSKKDVLQMQVELLYSREGHTLSYQSTDDIRKFNLDQLKFPILLKYKLFNPFYLVGGGYAGYIINVQEDTGTGGLRSIKDRYNNFDTGIVIGVEYHFNLGIFIESRYNYGLADISPIEFRNSTIKHNYKNRLVQFGVGYTF
jgi:hypothetical protein